MTQRARTARTWGRGAVALLLTIVSLVLGQAAQAVHVAVPGAPVVPAPTAPPASPAPPAPTAGPTAQPGAPAVPAPTDPSAPAPANPGAPAPGPLDRVGDALTNTQGAVQCKNPPVPGTPTDGLAGWIDGEASQPGDGPYSTYGYGGYEPVMFDPGCPISLEGGVSGLRARVFDPQNQTASLYMDMQLVAVSLAVEGAHIVFAPEGIWQLLTPITTFVRHTLGARWWFLFGSLALAATGLYWLVRSRRGDVAEAGSVSARSAIILTAGAAALATTVTAGSLVSAGVSAFYGAMAQATTQAAGTASAGGAQPGAQPVTVPDLGSVDAVLGDMLMQNVVYPSWVMVHFGNDTRAAEQFGPRLFAAGALTRYEAQRATSDPAYATSIQAAKQADYTAVAAEYQAAYPATYDRRLAGNDTSERPSAALAGLLACLPLVIFLVWSLWWMGTLRLVLDISLAIAPIGALVAQFPRFQWMATALVRWLSMYLLTAAIATSLFVVFVVGGAGGILGAGASTSSKVIAMVVLLLLARSVWKRRHLLTRRTGVDKDTRAVTAALESLREEYRNARVEREGRGAPASEPAAALSPAAAAALPAAGAGAVAGVVVADASPRRLDVDGAALTPPEETGEPLEAAPVVGPGLAVGPVGDHDAPETSAHPSAFDEAARIRVDEIRTPAEQAEEDTPLHSDRPRRLEPMDWPTDDHVPNLAEETPPRGDSAYPGENREPERVGAAVTQRNAGSSASPPRRGEFAPRVHTDPSGDDTYVPASVVPASASAAAPPPEDQAPPRLRDGVIADGSGA